jgi:hypothetical protein
MQTISYQNNYGTLVLEPVSEYRSVDGIRSDIVPENSRFYGIDVAEKVALITENRRIQIAFQMPLTRNSFGYILHHDSPNTCAICRISSMEYVGGDSKMEIRAHRHILV